MREVLPLKKRPVDLPIVIFFIINLAFVTYIIDVEQLVIADPNSFDYPLWPLPFMVDIVHWWGRNFDPVLMARPAWWRATIWIDALFFGPFYAAGIYAFIKGKEWIRVPSIIFSSVLFTNVFIILSEEIFGSHATPRLVPVLLANAPWIIFPVYIIIRMWRNPNPFTAEK
ncbi:MAG: hypothetical protein A2176_11025 [Spirochaetes bacterium RBG_13_51_14]|nr:MAG: hypothetical protein A2176_11025 [Spirochaetes bacterium RBG_13_51_14]